MIQNLYPLQVAQSSTWHILSGKANDNNGIAALDYFNYATDLSPTDASVYYRVGLAKDEWDFQGSLDGYSIDDYIKAAELDNNHPYANYKAGNKYSRYSCYNPEDQREAYIKAMHHLNRAIEINPNFIDAYLDRAHLHSNFDNAIADYDRAIELDPTRLDIHGFKANVHSRKGEHLEAIKIYGYIIQINPTDSEVYVNRGDAKSKLGDYKGAISDYSKRIELEPRDRYIYKERAIIKEKLGDFDGATADRQKFQDFYNR